MTQTNTDATVTLADYKVFPKHVGKWEGTVRVLDAELKLTKSYNIAQTFADLGDKWVITNTYSYPDGTSFSHSFDVIPIGNKEVIVEPSGDSSAADNKPVDVKHGDVFADAKLTAVEHGDNIVDFKVINTTTGLLREIETIILQGENQRVRTTQFFTETGDLKSLLVVVEHRVE